MSKGKSSRELIEELKKASEQREKDAATRTTRFRVNKRTHRVRFENEAEDSVKVVIEPKQEEGISSEDGRASMC